jgi:hypothetical protein
VIADTAPACSILAGLDLILPGPAAGFALE